MNKKDLAYLKRRLNVEHCHITSIRGLYVNGRKEPVSAFEVLPVRTSKEDMEKYCAIFKRVLSGEDAQNLLTVDFTPEQVISGEEYGLLTELKDCAIHNDELTDAFFEKVCACLPQMEDQHYLILLMHDKKEMTDVLPNILDHLIEEGYYFDTLENCPEYTTAE